MRLDGIHVVHGDSAGGTVASLGAANVRVRRDLVSSFTEPITQQTVHFVGVPLAVNTYTMRTEGVIVESLLGQASSLDTYAEELQRLEVQRRTAEVNRLTAEAARAELVNSIAEANNGDAAKLIAEMTCPCGCPPKQTPA